MSSRTRPQVVPHLYECLCSAEHKIFWRKWETSSSEATVDLHSICIFPTMEVNGALKQPGGQTFFQISSFVFGQRVVTDLFLFFGWTIPLMSNRFILVVLTGLFVEYGLLCDFVTFAKCNVIDIVNLTNIQSSNQMWPWTTKPVLSAHFSKLRFIHYLTAWNMVFT